MLEFLQSLFQNDAGQVADFWLFLGRFHPMVLHFPIGLLFLGAVLEVYAFIRKKSFDEAIKIAWLWGTVTSGIAVVLGFFLSLGGGYDENLLAWHFYGGTLIFVFALIAWFLRGHHKLGPAFKFFSVLTVAVMMLAAHDGASLTHGKEYVFKYAPDFVRTMTGREPKKEKKTRKPKPEEVKPTEISKADTPKEPALISYKNVIEPIFADQCYSCHGEEKQKGDLRMDVIPFEAESDDLIIPGKPDDSWLFELIVTDDMEDIMPPEGKGEVTAEQKELIRKWIEQGAKFDN